MAREGYVGNLAGAIKHFQKFAEATVREIQTEYQKDLQNTLDEPPRRTGRVYRIPGNRGSEHQASRKGEPPAPMTREYLQDIHSEKIRSVPGFYVGAVYTNQEQAVELERGLGNVLNEPRPAWEKTLLQNKSKYEKIVQRRIKTGE